MKQYVLSSSKQEGKQRSLEELGWRDLSPETSYGTATAATPWLTLEEPGDSPPAEQSVHVGEVSAEEWQRFNSRPTDRLVALLQQRSAGDISADELKQQLPFTINDLDWQPSRQPSQAAGADFAKTLADAGIRPSTSFAKTDLYTELLMREATASVALTRGDGQTYSIETYEPRQIEWQKPAIRELPDQLLTPLPFEQGESTTADAVTEAAEPQVEAVEPTSAEPTIEDLVVSISHAAAARYAGFVTFEDVQQQLQLFILSNAAQVARWYNNSGFHRVALALRGAAKRYSETEKAAACGYSFDDVAWYDPTMLEDLIPLALDERWDGTSPSSEDDGSMPRSKTDAAVGGTLLAMVMDVRRAIRRVGSDPTAVAEFLGGDFPGSKSSQKTPRRVLSNAAAAAAISSEVSN